MWLDAKIEVRSIPSARSPDGKPKWFIAIYRGDGHVEVETDYDTVTLIGLTIAPEFMDGQSTPLANAASKN